MRIKYLAQEHNAVPRPGIEPGPFDPESSALTIRPPRLPHVYKPGRNPGSSTNVITGILNASQKRTNRAPLTEALTSKQPAGAKRMKKIVE